VSFIGNSVGTRRSAAIRAWPFGKGTTFVEETGLFVETFLWFGRNCLPLPTDSFKNLYKTAFAMIRKQKKTYETPAWTIIRLDTGHLLAGSTTFNTTLEEDDEIKYSYEIL
jgi:hypothetical protein